MNEIKKYINRLFKSLPRTPETNKIKVNILDNMEEKFNDLINSGMEINEASEMVIREFGDINDIKQSLATKDLQEEYDVLISKYNKYMLFGFIGTVTVPFLVLFIYMSFIDNNVFPIGLVLLSSLPFGIIPIYTQYKVDKLKQVLETTNMYTLKILKKVISLFSISLMLVLYGISENIYITLSIIPFGFAFYYLFKFFKLEY